MKVASIKQRENKVPGTASHYVGIAVDIILLYILNNIQYLNAPFLVTDKYISCLWAINLALGIGIIGNFILLLYHPRWYYYFTEFVLDILAVLAFYIVYITFPFNLSQNIIQPAVKIILILVMAGVGISAFVELSRSVIEFTRREPPISPASPISPLNTGSPGAGDSSNPAEPVSQTAAPEPPPPPTPPKPE